MSYKMVNEELRIMSCGIEDLTEQQQASFVKQFKGDRVETLTMFHVAENDFLILNHDNKQFDFYKQLCESYLGFDLERREIFKSGLEGKSIESINLLDRVIRFRKNIELQNEAAKIRKMVMQQSITTFNDNFEIIKALRKIESSNSEYFFDYSPFMYGYIQGIRAERARRKKVSE